VSDSVGGESGSRFKQLSEHVTPSAARDRAGRGAGQPAGPRGGAQRPSLSTGLQGARPPGRHRSDPQLLLPRSVSALPAATAPRRVRHSGAAPTLPFHEVQFPTPHGPQPPAPVREPASREESHENPGLPGLTCPSWRRGNGGVARPGHGARLGGSSPGGGTNPAPGRPGPPGRGREPRPPVTQGSPPRAPRILFL